MNLWRREDSGLTVAHAASEFLDHVERSRLLTTEQIDAAVEALDICDDDQAAPTAKAFVKGGYLTRLQASRLLEGNYRGFFIDNYRIEDILGSGGMGWVYVARDLETDQRVALKMLCEQDDNDPGLLARFRLEGRAGLMLDHEAVVKTLKMGHTEGLYGNIHYTVMEYFEGIGIDEFVSLLKGPIKWPLACHIAYHAAAGLHHAHRNGLIHRDVKPANILVDGTANAKVLDFGLSLVSQSSEGEEFSLAMIFGQDCLGTADYIAPEQAVDSFTIDHRADIYSLGATLFFMLTGRLMFADCHTRADKIEAQKLRTPPRIREINPDVPAEVEAIVNRMLEKNPEDRFPSAKVVCAELVKIARPTKIHFNFQTILDRRYAIAQQRLKLLSERAQKSSQQTSLTFCSLDSRASRTSQSAIETTIRKDTQVNRPAEVDPTVCDSEVHPCVEIPDEAPMLKLDDVQAADSDT